MTFYFENHGTEFFRTIEDFVKLKPSLTADELSVLAGQISGKVKNIESMSHAKCNVETDAYADEFQLIATFHLYWDES